MTHKITIRLTVELERWLSNRSRATGIPKSELVRADLEKARAEKAPRRFMRLAGTVTGPSGLSSGKGYSRVRKSSPTRL